MANYFFRNESFAFDLARSVRLINNYFLAESNKIAWESFDDPNSTYRACFFSEINWV